ncbi:hypothetical protein D9758_009129 [Tetrapyrgos nigripes]|uniref:Cyclin-like domain-containing protein n=1 Tax=Tetrapyrgos nigripes TaxID=182062 RepID=A0A8H5G8L9_9AGAR|nr:hypothetical protein D9758_009129 [Tetrapyrgos nigripes]
MCADPYYGYESMARLCARFVTRLFGCPETPASVTHSQTKLPIFIAYALHRTKLHSSVVFASLVLLQRLKARFPTTRGHSGHRLFLTAFMIASKVICDDTYSNKSWSVVSQGMFTLRELNQMEREMCNYLQWEFNVENHPMTLSLGAKGSLDIKTILEYPLDSESSVGEPKSKWPHRAEILSKAIRTMESAAMLAKAREAVRSLGRHGIHPFLKGFSSVRNHGIASDCHAQDVNIVSDESSQDLPPSETTTSTLPHANPDQRLGKLIFHHKQRQLYHNQLS